MNLNNLCKAGFKGLSTLVVAGKISEVRGYDISDMLNGFQFELTNIPKEDKTQYKDSALLWNKADKSLYMVTRYIGNFNEEVADRLAHAVIGNWPSEFEVKGGDVESAVIVKPGIEDVTPSLIPLIPPKGQHFLGVLFDIPKKQLMYEDFITDPFIYDRMLKLCKSNNLRVTAEMTTTSSLPVHKKDKNTGELLISDRVLRVFEQYQFCQNYLTSFDPGSPEFDLGKTMTLDQVFCSYMMERARKLEAKKSVSEVNYIEQLTKAARRIMKDPELFRLFKSDLAVEV